jgi:hypothetical protein
LDGFVFVLLCGASALFSSSFVCASLSSRFLSNLSLVRRFPREGEGVLVFVWFFLFFLFFLPCLWGCALLPHVVINQTSQGLKDGEACGLLLTIGVEFDDLASAQPLSNDQFIQFSTVQL